MEINRQNPDLVSPKDLAKLKSFITRVANNAIQIKIEEKVKSQIVDAIHSYQHKGFINGIEWDVLKERLKTDLVKEFSGVKTDLGIKSLDKMVVKEIENAKGYYVSDQGSKFKAYKTDADSRAEATQIKTPGPDGRVFELLNTLTEEQSELLLEQSGIRKEGKTLMGSGSFGKVRLARDVDTGEIIVVKKFDSPYQNNHDLAETEAKQYKNLSEDDHLINYRGLAHITETDVNGYISQTSYLFIDLAGDRDGHKAISELNHLRVQDQAGAGRLIKENARQYLEGVDALHRQGKVHRDLKPANFFHSGKDSKVGDYGMVTNNRYAQYSGTPEYSPLEAVLGDSSGYAYDGVMHDAFSLGMSLLQMKLGSRADEIPNKRHLTINGKKVTLKFQQFTFPPSSQPRNVSVGLSNLGRLKGDTLDEVIALLLQAVPNKRITPGEALKLPYFKSDLLLETGPVSQVQRMHNITDVLDNAVRHFEGTSFGRKELGKDLVDKIDNGEVQVALIGLSETSSVTGKSKEQVHEELLNALSNAEFVACTEVTGSGEQRVEITLRLDDVEAKAMGANRFESRITGKDGTTFEIIVEPDIPTPLMRIALKRNVVTAEGRTPPRHWQTDLGEGGAPNAPRLRRPAIRRNRQVDDGVGAGPNASTLSRSAARRSQPDDGVGAVQPPVSVTRGIRKEIGHQIAPQQKKAFLSNQSWEQAKETAVRAILDNLNEVEEFQGLSQNLLRDLVNEEIINSDSMYVLQSEGGLFKAPIAPEQQGYGQIPHTMVRTANGDVFELLENLSEAESKDLQRIHRIHREGRTVLGEGNFGKVIFAKSLVTGEISAVKIMDDRDEALKEIEIFEKVPYSKRLVNLNDFAHVRSGVKKLSYLFMDYAGDKTLTNTMHEIRATTHLTERFSSVDGDKLRDTAQKMLHATRDLHRGGVAHRDIYLNNFFVKGDQVTLGDFGMSTDRERDSTTPMITPFAPPDQIETNARHGQYSSFKHDSFALGMSLLELKYGTRAHLQPNFQLELGGRPINFQFFSVQTQNSRGPVVRQICSGLKGTEALAGNTLDEVIAKLMDGDPEKRISPRMAMQLPYFTNSDPCRAEEICSSQLRQPTAPETSNTRSLIDGAENISEHQRTHFANYLDGLPVEKLAELGAATIDSIVDLLTEPRQRLACTTRFHNHRENRLELRMAYSRSDVLSRDWSMDSLYDKLAAASKIAGLRKSGTANLTMVSTHSQKTSILQAARNFNHTILNSGMEHSLEVAGYIREQMLKAFHQNREPNRDQLRETLNNVLEGCNKNFQLSQELNGALNDVVRRAISHFMPTGSYTKQLDNIDGRAFESRLARTMITKRPSKEMRVMMSKILDQMRAFDPGDTLIERWSREGQGHVYPVADAYGRSSDWKRYELLSCKNLPLFYDFHNFVNHNLETVREPELRTVQDDAYQKEVIANRGGHIKIDFPQSTNKGGIELGEDRHYLEWQDNRAQWLRPIDRHYSAGPFAQEAARHDVPLGSGLSGRTVQHLFGQHDLEDRVVRQIKAKVPRLTADETQLFLAGLWATLCSDGGHALEEVLYTAERVSERGVKFLGTDQTKKQAKDTQFDFFSQLVRKQKASTADKYDQHAKFYARIPDPQFQAYYHDLWDQFCAKKGE